MEFLTTWALVTAFCLAVVMIITAVALVGSAVYHVFGEHVVNVLLFLLVTFVLAGLIRALD